MSDQKHGISWTDQTWNPIVGCTKVSAGCQNCWAERMAKLHYHADFPNGWDGHVKLFPERLEQPLHWRKPRKIAVGLMGDLFHNEVPIHFQENVFRTAIYASQHVFQFLTKRADIMAWRIPIIMNRIYGSPENWRMPDNVWLGISVEDQKTADERIPLLLQTPAVVRFVSAEPLLGPIDIRFRDPGRKPMAKATAIACPKCEGSMSMPVPGGGAACGVCFNSPGGQGYFPPLDWVIAGCEAINGRLGRHADVDLFRSLRDQCVSAQVPFHLKQMEVNGKLTKMPALDNVVWLQFPGATK